MSVAPPPVVQVVSSPNDEEGGDIKAYSSGLTTSNHKPSLLASTAYSRNVSIDLRNGYPKTEGLKCHKP